MQFKSPVQEQVHSQFYRQLYQEASQQTDHLPWVQIWEQVRYRPRQIESVSSRIGAQIQADIEEWHV